MYIDPSKFRILIADDGKTNALLLTTILSKEGYQIDAAVDGKEALEIVNRKNPDLILLDVMMPEMDGFTAAKHLKSNDLHKNIPIIFLTALNDTDSIIKAFEIGGNDFISKPFRREELLMRVKRQLSSVAACRMAIKQAQEMQEIMIERTNTYLTITSELSASMNSAKILMNTLASEIDNGNIKSHIMDIVNTCDNTSEKIATFTDELNRDVNNRS